MLASARCGGNIHFCANRSAIDQNIEAVLLRVESVCVGKGQPQIVFARTDREIHPELGAVKAVAVQFRLLSAGDFFDGGIRPPARQPARVKSMPRPNYDFRRGPPPTAFGCRDNLRGPCNRKSSVAVWSDRCPRENYPPRFPSKLHAIGVNAIALRIGITRGKGGNFQRVFTRLQTVFVIESLPGAKRDSKSQPAQFVWLRR